MLYTTWVRKCLLVVPFFALFTVVPSPAASLVEFRVAPAESHFPQNVKNEPTIAINPLDPSNVIVGSNDLSVLPDCRSAPDLSSACVPPTGASETGVSATSDGGHSWSHQVLDWPSLGLASVGDPALTYGPRPNSCGYSSYSNGTRAYFSTLVHSTTGEFDGEAVAVANSDDGGKTWNGPVLLGVQQTPVGLTYVPPPTPPYSLLTAPPDTAESSDKPTIWVDGNPSSPFLGNVYVSWTATKGEDEENNFIGLSQKRIMFTRSKDGGQTFDKPSQVSSAVNLLGTSDGQSPVIRTTPTGLVFIFWDGSANFSKAALGAYSTDGGVSFGAPFLVASKLGFPASFERTSFRLNDFTMADIDPSNSNIFVVWPVYSNGHGTLMLARSSDRGGTWIVTTAANVKDRSPFFPAIAASNNQVFIGFNAIDDLQVGKAAGIHQAAYDSYYVLSRDGGVSFDEPNQISGASSDPDVSATVDLQSQFLGDYNGAAAGGDGTFWFAWTDTRNGSSCAAIDAWRALSKAAAPLDIYSSCKANFGSSDIYVAKVVP